MKKTRFTAALIAVGAMSAMAAPAAQAADYRGVLSMAPYAELINPFQVTASFRQQIVTPDLAPYTSGQLRLNYRVAGNWAVQAELGRSTDAILPLRMQRDSQSMGLDAVGTLQVSSAFAVMARAGLRRLSLESDPAQLIQNGQLNQAKLGLGLQYQFSRSLGFRAEVERYRNLGSDRATADTDGDAVRFDVYWRF